MKRILICVGGTGGHVFPAISLAEELRQNRPDIDFLFIGGRLETNKFFPKDLYPYHSIDCSPLSFSKPWKLPLSGWNILCGLRQSNQLLKKYRPDLIVAFGSYYTFPTLVAARLAQVPYILHESNRVPGKVNRIMASGAVTTALHFPDVMIKGNKAQVSMPLRPGCRKGAVTKEQAAAYYGLDPSKRTLLVMGGSQGAHALNQIVGQTQFPFEQIIHLTGKISKPKENGMVVKAFEPEMRYALTLADAAVCRAGASTIAELIEFELPAVLIPYPQATENHQEVNARFFEETVKGGKVILERDLTSAALLSALEEIKEFKNSIHTYKTLHSFDTFENLITKTVERLTHE